MDANFARTRVALRHVRYKRGPSFRSRDGIGIVKKRKRERVRVRVRGKGKPPIRLEDDMRIARLDGRNAKS